jgi:NAD(P)-dependent dehydrogenase (short-subunit alcohol dehydrogenase family)
MKIIVVGATGTIGSVVVSALASRHQVIGVSRHGKIQVDLEDSASIAGLFRAIPDPDAVICCAGNTAFKPLADLNDQDFVSSLGNKLMGQVRLARAALTQLRRGGSITLTSGIAARSPVRGSAAVSLVNAGLEGFTRAAALEASRGIRVNVVSPPWLDETLARYGMQAEEHMPAARVAPAYVAAVEGKHQGEVLDPARFA